MNRNDRPGLLLAVCPSVRPSHRLFRCRSHCPRLCLSLCASLSLCGHLEFVVVVVVDVVVAIVRQSGSLMRRATFWN